MGRSVRPGCAVKREENAERGSGAVRRRH